MDSAPPESAMERLHRLEQCVQDQRDRFEARAAEERRAAATREQQMADLTAHVQQLATALGQLATSSQPAPAAPAPPASPAPAAPGSTQEPRVGVPERYGGEPEGCSPFITNCSILFALQPHTFATEQAKVAFMVNHLTGKARLWGTAEWERQTPACSSFATFAAELRKVFGPVARGPDAMGGLLGLRQGGRTATDYALEFRVRARRSEWNAAAQVDAFLLGLADYLKDELVSYELPSSLDSLIELVLRLDQRIQGRRRERRWGFAGRSSAPLPFRPPERVSHQGGEPVEQEEPMQVGGARRSAGEPRRRQGRPSCLQCGAAGHMVSSCPGKGPTHQ